MVFPAKGLLNDFLDQQVFDHLPCRPVTGLKIGPHMTLGFIDPTKDFPVAFIQAVTADKPLIFSFAVKNMHFKAHIPASQLFQVGFKPCIRYPLFIIG